MVVLSVIFLMEKNKAEMFESLIGAGSTISLNGSAEPDPDQNEMDLQHW